MNDWNTETLNIKEWTFSREDLWARVIVDTRIAQVENMDKYIKDRLVYSLESWMLSAQKQTKTVDLPRPRFLDWLLRRTKTVTIECNDVLLDPPQIPKHQTLRLSTIDMPKLKRSPTGDDR